MLQINGVSIKSPKSLEVTVQDLDGETNRNAAGTLIRDRIATKRKINLEWSPLSQTEIATLLNAVSSEFFTVNFPDPQLGMTTKTMYVGDRTAPVYQIKNGEVRWNGLKMNFIEK